MAKRWSKSVGPYGARILLYDRGKGHLYAQVFDPRLKAGGQHPYRQVALKGFTKSQAERWAMTESAKLLEGTSQVHRVKPILKTVMALYLRFRSPQKSDERQYTDRRSVEMWTKVLGANKDLRKLSRREWEAFCRDRTNGAIDAKGNAVPERKRRPVSARSVEMDCHWLRAVCLWATTWQDDAGNYLLTEDPTRGFRRLTPHQKNPKRPIATFDRYMKIRAVTDKVTMDVRWTGRRIPKRSHLSELLDMAFFTGRRISAICELTHGDLRLDVGPYGAIRWPADSDKMDKEWENIPMEPGARKAIDRILQMRTVATDDTPLFPSPNDRTKPIRYELARDWLRSAERLANVPKQQGGAWHPYRRGWATARKTMSTKDVAALGGWGSESVLRDVYQQADMAGMIEVIEAQAKLREVK